MSEVILLLCVVPTWVIAGSRGDARGTKVEPYACNENIHTACLYYRQCIPRYKFNTIII